MTETRFEDELQRLIAELAELRGLSTEGAVREVMQEHVREHIEDAQQNNVRRRHLRKMTASQYAMDLRSRCNIGDLSESPPLPKSFFDDINA